MKIELLYWHVFCSQQMYLLFTHLEFRVAIATHNSKCYNLNFILGALTLSMQGQSLYFLRLQTSNCDITMVAALKKIRTFIIAVNP